MSERARRKEKDFTLDVLLANNRAKTLYERLGFVADRPSAGKIRMKLGG